MKKDGAVWVDRELMVEPIRALLVAAMVEAAVLASVAGEAGQELLNSTAQAIFRNIQCKLSQLLEA